MTPSQALLALDELIAAANSRSDGWELRRLRPVRDIVAALAASEEGEGAQCDEPGCGMLRWHPGRHGPGHSVAPAAPPPSEPQPICNAESDVGHHCQKPPGHGGLHLDRHGNLWREAPQPEPESGARHEGPGDEESEDNFCPDPCGGMLYLAASAGSAWIATCGSCGKVWPQQPWATERAPGGSGGTP